MLLKHRIERKERRVKVRDELHRREREKQAEIEREMERKRAGAKHTDRIAD